jgi:hypothetical protein
MAYQFKVPAMGPSTDLELRVGPLTVSKIRTLKAALEKAAGWKVVGSGDVPVYQANLGRVARGEAPAPTFHVPDWCKQTGYTKLPTGTGWGFVSGIHPLVRPAAPFDPGKNARVCCDEAAAAGVAVAKRAKGFEKVMGKVFCSTGASVPLVLELEALARLGAPNAVLERALNAGTFTAEEVRGAIWALHRKGLVSEELHVHVRAERADSGFADRPETDRYLLCEG